MYVIIRKCKTLVRIIYQKVTNVRWGRKGKWSYVKRPLRIVNKSKIFLGDNVRILNGVRMEVIPGYDASIHIGKGTSMEQSCHIIAANHLEIGDDCVFSAWVYVSDCNHIYTDEIMMDIRRLEVKKTKIGNHVFLGIGSKIMPGVTVGDYAVVGANAVVTKDVPARAIVGGVPARIIGENDHER